MGTGHVDSRVVLEATGCYARQPRSLAFRYKLGPLMNRLPRNPETESEATGAAEVSDGDLCSHFAPVKHAEQVIVKRTLHTSDYDSPSVETNGGDDPVKLADLIKARRIERGINQAELARRLGVSRAALSDIESGKTRSLRGATMAGIVRELGLTPEELSGKRTLPRGKINYAQAVGPFGPQLIKRIPVMGVAVLDPQGCWRELQPVRGTLDFPTDDESAYAIRIISDALHPRIRAGEYVVMEPGHECAAGDEILLTLLDGRSMLRELAHVIDGIVAVNGLTNALRQTFRADEIASMDFVAAIVKSTRFRES